MNAAPISAQSPTDSRFKLPSASANETLVRATAESLIQATVTTTSTATPANETASDATRQVSRARWPKRLAAKVQSLITSRSTPGFLVSFIMHTGLLLLLALITMAGPGRGGFQNGILVSAVEQSSAPDVQMVDSMLASGDVVEDAMDSALAAAQALQAGDQSISAGAMGAATQDLAKLADNGPGVAAALPMSSAGQLTQAMASNMNASLASSSVEGRKPQSRQQLALERGGSGDSEAAVELALQWLAAHQKPDGSWSLMHAHKDCDGSCDNPGSPERYEPAATGLALLAFLGAGYTHRDGQYASHVKRGLYYLLQIMEETQHGGSFMVSSPQGMYNHGIATFALCEAYQLSGDESFKKPCQQAVEFIVYAQHDGGGWGYLPKRPGDLTITGWQVMALKSADAAGIYIPSHTIVRIDKFLDSQGDKDKVFYGYGAPAPKNETCTAIGLLLRMFRGWPHSDPRVLTGATYLEREGVSSHDVYRNYYVTLMLYHVGGMTFNNWNPRMRDALVNSQSRTGHAKGSWYFDDKWGKIGGRHYTTAMAAMTLEVYYRFSPLYLNSDKPFEY